MVKPILENCDMSIEQLISDLSRINSTLLDYSYDNDDLRHIVYELDDIIAILEPRKSYKICLSDDS